MCSLANKNIFQINNDSFEYLVDLTNNYINLEYVCTKSDFKINIYSTEQNRIENIQNEKAKERTARLLLFGNPLSTYLLLFYIADFISICFFFYFENVKGNLGQEYIN